MATTPNYYLQNLERKKKASEDFREKIGGHLGEATDTLSKLSERLSGDAKDKEKLDYERGQTTKREGIEAGERTYKRGRDTKSDEIAAADLTHRRTREEKTDADALAELTRKLEDRKRNQDFEDSERARAGEERETKAEEAARARNLAEAPAAVTATIDRTSAEQPDELMEDLARQAGVTVSDFKAERVKQGEAKIDKNLGREKTEAEIAKLKRPPEADPLKEMIRLLTVDKMKNDAADAAKGKPIPVEQVNKSITTPRETIAVLGDLGEAAKDQTMGPGSWAWGLVPDWASAIKPADVVKFQGLSAEAERLVSKAKEDGAIQGGEQAMYKKQLQNAMNSKEAYLAELKRVTGEIKRRQAAHERALRDSGYNVPPGGPQAEGAAAADDLNWEQ